jgi:hypothetical protein
VSAFTSTLFIELAVSSAMILATATTHGIGLSLLARGMSSERREERAHHMVPMSLRAMGYTLLIVMGLFALHGIEIWLYAALYDAIGAAPGFEEALYFSTISYAAIGYSDVAIADSWRLVGAIEGINGVILLGWSTAFFVSQITRLRP